jgi:arylsulfatase A-like enzyme
MRNTKIITISFTIACITSCQSKIEQKPNILIINVDDMGWRDAGFMGSDFYETPNLDSLAWDGMIFTDAYASAANCAPSRAGLLTGKWGPRHKIYTVGSSERGKKEHRKLVPVENITILDTSFLTISEVFKENGYSTCQAGKWHMDNDPGKHGFNLSIGGGANGHPKSYYPPYGNVQIESSNDLYLTDAIMKQTINYIDTVSSPFFLYYSPYAVHTPIQPVDSLLDNYRHKLHWNGQFHNEYATMIENLDRNIGDLLSKIKERDFYENTIIVFTSDNGGLYGITYQPPLRAGKGSYYEGGIRVPLVFTWEGRIRPNTTNNSPVSNLDLFPTLMSCAEIDYDPLDYDGIDLLPVLEETTVLKDRPLYWHFPIYLQAYDPANNQNRDSLFRTRPGSVIRYGDWKLHYYFEDQGIELYNLELDIGESNNLARDSISRTEQLLEKLNEWWVRTGAALPEELNPDYQSAIGGGA